MPMEIKLLVWSVALTLLQVAIAASGTVLTVGLVDGVGNRDNMPVFTGWVGRAHRAHRNMIESSLALRGARAGRAGARQVQRDDSARRTALFLGSRGLCGDLPRRNSVAAHAGMDGVHRGHRAGVPAGGVRSTHLSFPTSRCNGSVRGRKPRARCALEEKRGTQILPRGRSMAAASFSEEVGLRRRSQPGNAFDSKRLDRLNSCDFLSWSNFDLNDIIDKSVC